MRKFIRVVNVPRHLCRLALGKEHTIGHRLAAGLVVMCVGVGVAKLGEGLHMYAVHFVLDVGGFFLHAVGGVPYIEWLIEE